MPGSCVPTSTTCRGVLDAGFDIVYTAMGVLAWLPDLSRLGGGGGAVPEARRALLPAGDSSPRARSTTRHRWTRQGTSTSGTAISRTLRAFSFQAAGPLMAGDEPIESPCHEWQHSIGEILNRLAGRGSSPHVFRGAPGNPVQAVSRHDPRGRRPLASAVRRGLPAADLRVDCDQVAPGVPAVMDRQSAEAQLPLPAGWLNQTGIGLPVTCMADSGSRITSAAINRSCNSAIGTPRLSTPVAPAIAAAVPAACPHAHRVGRDPARCQGLRSCRVATTPQPRDSPPPAAAASCTKYRTAVPSADRDNPAASTGCRSILHAPEHYNVILPFRSPYIVARQRVIADDSPGFPRSGGRTAGEEVRVPELGQRFFPELEHGPTQSRRPWISAFVQSCGFVALPGVRITLK